MTLTDNTRRIEYLAGQVMGFADSRDYEMAHCALDNIEIRVHALRRHLDMLQWITHKVPRPPGDPKP